MGIFNHGFTQIYTDGYKRRILTAKYTKYANKAGENTTKSGTDFFSFSSFGQQKLSNLPQKPQQEQQ